MGVDIIIVDMFSPSNVTWDIKLLNEFGKFLSIISMSFENALINFIVTKI